MSPSSPVPFSLSKKDAPIRRARIHPKEAFVTRRWTGEVSSSDIVTLIFPVPKDVLEDEVSATATALTADGERPVEVVSIRSVPWEQPSEVRRAGGRAEALADPSEIRVLEAEEAQARRRQRLLEHHARLARRFIAETWVSKAPPLEQWSAFFEKYRTEATRLATAAASRKAKRAKLTKNRAPNGESGGVKVVLRLARAKPESVTVDLTFRTTLVGWSPAYAIRVDPPHVESEEREVQMTLVLAARVDQKTEEAWQDVQIELWTEPPSVPEPAPELGRLMVGGFQGPPTNPADRPELAAASIQDASRDFGRIYQPPSPIFVAGSSSTRIDLLVRRVTWSLTVEARTEGPAVAWRIAEGPAPDDLPSAPGAVLWGGKFSGFTEVSATRIGEKMAINLGVEPTIEVQRTDRRQPPTRSRGTNRLEHRFARRAVIRNMGPQPVTIDVRGRLPVAGSRDVEVEIHELPPRTAVDGSTGRLHAVIHLLPGAERELLLDFSVHAPRTVVVEGPDGTAS